MAQESVQTADVKSVFLDIASFTRRTVEAQTDVIGVLNNIVRECLADLDLHIEDPDKCLVLPTGDGMCICQINQAEPFDIHIQLAKRMLEKLQTHNEEAKGTEAEFGLRVGVNSNIDNLVIDIMGRPNIAGAGINQAQRLMDSGDPCQIMVGAAVYEVLRHRKQYRDGFRKFSMSDKNGVTMEVYQLVQPGVPGLNAEVPSRFRPKTIAPKKFPRLLAYHAALCEKHRASIKEIKKKCVTDEDGIFISLWILASDCVSKENESDNFPHRYDTKPSFESGLEEIVAYYRKIDPFIIIRFAERLRLQWWDLGEYFEVAGALFGFLFLTPAGLQKLKVEHPDVLGKVGAMVSV